jgi:cell division protein FtsL
MIVMDNKNLVNGSTALAPKYKPYKPNIDEELEKRKKAEKEKEKLIAEKRAKRKAQVLLSIACVFITGVILIGRYAAVYNLQSNLTKVKTEIHNTTMENEDLKVQLLKAGNIQQIEETAKTKLNMMTPDKKNVMYMTTTKDYFAKVTKEENNKQEDLIAKLKNILF